MARQQLFTIFLHFFVHMISADLGGFWENDLGYGKWFRPTLTYKIVKYPENRRHPRMTGMEMKRYVDSCIQKAVSLWEPAVPVLFLRTDENDADIKVLFLSGDHLDGYVFDGKGGEVAHTFYPDKPRRGQIHIDDDEPWAPDGRNLEWVLAHELGHALGIPHQKGPSLMEEGYRGYHKRPKLTLIDILAVRKLYA